MSATEWIAKRRELLVEFLKPYRGKRHDTAGLSILAMSDLPRALNALEAVLAHHCPGEGSSQGYTPDGSYGNIEPYCAGCEASDEYAVAWPCATVRAIESALRADS